MRSLVDITQLKKQLSNEEFDYNLLSHILSDYSAPRLKIHALMNAGVIVRVKKGLYIFGPEYNQVPVCKEVLANLIYGPSYISMEYALSFHSMIPERVESITSVTCKKSKEFQTPIGHFTYSYLTLKKYSVGIEQVWLDHQHPVLMAGPEKALCDYLTIYRVPDLENEKGMKSFLTEDLRIDIQKWKQWDPKVFRTLNKNYQNKNIHILERLL